MNDPRKTASRLALTTDAMDVMFPNAANMTEQELQGIFQRLEDLRLAGVCPYTRKKFTTDNPAFFSLEPDGTFRVGLAECMEARNVRDGRPHTAIQRILEPITNLRDEKRQAREKAERERVAEARRITELCTKVQDIVDLLRRINIVDQNEMDDVSFRVWLLEVAADRKIPEADVDTYWTELRRWQDEAELARLVKLEEAAARSTETLTPILEDNWEFRLKSALAEGELNDAAAGVI